MSFLYYPSFDRMVPSFRPLFPEQQQHLQTTTIIISNFQSCSESAHKNFYLNQALPTQTTTLDQLGTHQPKKQVGPRKRLPKKEISRRKDQNFGWRCQKKGRNFNSIILKGYVQFILVGKGMIRLVEDLSKKLGLENGVSAFYKFINETFPQNKAYLGLRYMQNVLNGQTQAQALVHMLGVTLRYYLKEIYPITVCIGAKSKKKLRLQLLKKARSILSQMFE